MQSSDMKAAHAARDAYKDESDRDAFADGYNSGHGLACHNVPEIGQKLCPSIDWVGYGTVDSDNIGEVHEMLCFEAESNARCYSPWEFIAHRINGLDESHGEGASESAWESYQEGVALAIAHDLKGYEYE